MKAILFGLILLLTLSPLATGLTEEFNEVDLAATMASDSGHPEEGYLDYARSLARTLNLLSPSQSTRVLKGKRPLKKAEIDDAKTSPDGAKDEAAKDRDEPKNRR